MSGNQARTAPAWLAGAAAIMPLVALNALPVAHATETQAAFAPPTTPLVLTRTLHSPLADGREIVSRRSYEVVITAEGGGWRVDGRLIDSDVTAPPQLAFLAELERKRPDDGLFPLFLDARGRIQAGGETAGEQPRRDAAEAGLAVVESQAGDARTRQQAGSLLGQLKRQPVLTAWPEDLFHPAPGHRTASREFVLPDGTRGEVSIEVEAGSEAQAPLTAPVSSMRRTITTRMGTSERSLREEWTLARVMGN